jgi:hypothetical protein
MNPVIAVGFSVRGFRGIGARGRGGAAHIVRGRDGRTGTVGVVRVHEQARAEPPTLEDAAESPEGRLGNGGSDGRLFHRGSFRILVVGQPKLLGLAAWPFRLADLTAGRHGRD